MPRVIELPDIGWEGLVEFGLDWSELSRMWLMVLAMAVRDGASSASYHPWRTGWHLSYLVKNVQYALVPPPPELSRRIVAVAGAMISGDRFGAISRRLFGWPLHVSGRVRLKGPQGESEWVGVVWSAGESIGVEWHRLDLE